MKKLREKLIKNIKLGTINFVINVLKLFFFPAEKN